jgi:hypothetical protein
MPTNADAGAETKSGPRGFLLVVGALACFAFALLVRSRASALIELVDRGNVLLTNEVSGISHGAAGALLGRVQFLALAVGGLLVHVRGGRLSRYAVAWAVVATALVTVSGIDAHGILDGGRSVFQLEDDAMISMRYARNLAHGLGLVYNAGERVEGYTNFLWVLVMAVVHVVGIPDRLTSAVVIVIDGVLVAGAVLLVGRILHRHHVAAALVLVACLALAFDANVVMWCGSGLETVGEAFLVTWCAWALVTESRPSAFLAPLSLLPLIRADGALLAAMLGAVFLLTTARRMVAVRQLALAALPGAAHLAFRVSYYGYPLPNTFYVKMIGAHERLIVGLGGYGYRLLIAYGILVALVGFLMASRWAGARLRLLAGVVLAQAAYGVYLGGDTFWDLRFFTPVIPLAYALGALAVDRLVQGMPAQRVTAVGCAAFALMPFRAHDGRLGNLKTNRKYWHTTVATAQLIRDNTPKGTTLSVAPAGAVPYFAPEHRFVDVLGLNEEHIAHHAPAVGTAIGHNRFDFDWVYGTRRPDLAFTAFPCDWVDDFERLTEEERQQRLQGHAPEEYLGPLYEIADRRFREDYYPGRVTIEGDSRPERFGCFYVRQGVPISRTWELPR